ncbi:hypothetical protein BS50DRAFT_591584 [Corynespora cassiicola Philippines]|uniref:Uncharacterized protein n=1 Tax=Corynespora cassiicola Philippines TaxID=1448308 RepID=A0A2T2NEH5_CORCC|nr:hypothetical protein BS50DRAFT_591584 [Corynespora cassiicola Philippines]
MNSVTRYRAMHAGYYENAAGLTVWANEFESFREDKKEIVKILVILEKEMAKYTSRDVTREKINKIVQQEYSMAEDRTKEAQSCSKKLEATCKPVEDLYSMKAGRYVASIHFPSIKGTELENRSLFEILNSQILSLCHKDDHKDAKTSHTFPGAEYFESFLRNYENEDHKDYFIHLARSIEPTYSLFIVFYGIEQYPEQQEANDLVNMLLDLCEELNGLNKDESKSEKTPYLKVLFIGPGSSKVLCLTENDQDGNQQILAWV